MFTNYTAIRNIKRQKTKSLINLCISIVIVLLLNVYFGNISSIKRQMDTLPEAIPVTGTISNLNGSMQSGIAIEERIISGIERISGIKDPIFSIQLKIGFGEKREKDNAEELSFTGVGCNDRRSISGLQPDDLSWNAEGENNFYTTNRKECIVDKTILEDKKLKLGDEVPLTIYYYQYTKNNHEIKLEPLTSEKFKIVASMDIKEYTGDNVKPNVMIPFGAVRDIFKQQNLEFKPDSASFTVEDPFHLNQLKKQMKELKLLNVAAEAEFQYDGNSLVIDDKTFIQAAEQLEESRSLLNLGLPFIIAMIALIGYIMAYLMIQSRKGEYAIMRSVGMKHSECFRVLFLESALLQLSGGLVGSLLSFLIIGLGIQVIGTVIAMYLVCYLLGTAVALINLGRLSVVDVLSKHD